MNALWLLPFIALLIQAPGNDVVGRVLFFGPGISDQTSLFERGKSWQQFIDGVAGQRELWLRTEAAVTVPADVIERARKARKGLQVMVVAEDWCPDSVYTVPYIARLAQAADIPLRILDRVTGEPLMLAHRTADGRTATPTVVAWRDGRDAGAWVERPAELQQMFLSMSTSPENSRRFAQRQVWYESDGGRTVLKEVVSLIEQIREKK